MSDADAPARVQPILTRARARTVQVDDFASFELAAARPFDLVVAQVPLPGAGIGELLELLHSVSSAADSRQPVLFATEASLAEIELLPAELRERPLIATSPTRALRAIAHALGMNNRAFVRLMVRCELPVGETRFERMCQTHDVSTTGMLLRTARDLPVGTAFPFVLELPEDDKPIAGRGRIVRRAEADREGATGVGVQFLSLGGDGAARLERFVDTTLTGRHG